MNVTRKVELWINEHPMVMDCLKSGLVNYSALARRVSRDEGLVSSNFDAVLIACRRYSRKLKGEQGAEERIRHIIKNSKLAIQNRMCAVVLEKRRYLDDLLELQRQAKRKGEGFYIVEGASSITIIISQDFLPEIKKQFKGQLIKVNEGLAEVIVKSGPEIETTPGVVAYIYSLLASAGINIAETASCWTDTIFLVDEKDIPKVMELFS